MKTLLAISLITLLSAFCACRSSQPDAASSQQPAAGGKTFVDLLAAQLTAINYPSVVTRDGNAVTVRIGSAQAAHVRRAMCWTRGWPSGNRMVRLDETLRRLRLAEGITRIQLIGNNESLDVSLDEQGKCEKSGARDSQQQ